MIVVPNSLSLVSVCCSTQGRANRDHAKPNMSSKMFTARGRPSLRPEMTATVGLASVTSVIVCFSHSNPFHFLLLSFCPRDARADADAEDEGEQQQERKKQRKVQREHRALWRLLRTLMRLGI